MMRAMPPADTPRPDEHAALIPPRGIARTAPLTPRAVHVSGALLVLSSISWVNTTVQEYGQGLGAALPQFVLRVLPMLGLFAWLFRADLRRGFIAARRVPTSASMALLWYALVGALSGLGSRLPLLSLWKAVELGIVAYWMAHASLAARAAGDAHLPLRSVVRPLALLMAWTLLIGLAVPSKGFRHHMGGIPSWLQGWFPPLNPNTVGTISAVALYALMYVPASFRSRRWHRTLLMLVGAAWILAISRTAYVAFIVAMGSTLAARFLRLRTDRDIVHIAISLLLTGAAMLFAHQITEFALRGQSEENVQSLSGRTAYWQVALEMWEKRPLLGGGLATGSRFLFLDFPELFRHGAVNIHNSYLEMLLGAGLVGSLPWLFLLLRVVFSSIREAVRRGAFPPHGALLLIEMLRATTSIAAALFSFDLLVLTAILVAHEYETAHGTRRFTLPRPRSTASRHPEARRGTPRTPATAFRVVS